MIDSLCVFKTPKHFSSWIFSFLFFLVKLVHLLSKWLLQAVRLGSASRLATVPSRPPGYAQPSASSENCCNLPPQIFVVEAATGTRGVLWLLIQGYPVQILFVLVQLNMEFISSFHCHSDDLF